jgi:hypothetical protein
MIQKAYAVYDTQVKAYLNPYYQHEDGAAIRMFRNACNDKTHAFGQNPADYTLFYIGTYEDKTGQHAAEPPKSLGNGLEHQINEPTDG